LSYLYREQIEIPPRERHSDPIDVRRDLVKRSPRKPRRETFRYFTGVAVRNLRRYAGCNLNGDSMPRYVTDAQNTRRPNEILAIRRVICRCRGRTTDTTRTIVVIRFAEFRDYGRCMGMCRWPILRPIYFLSSPRAGCRNCIAAVNYIDLIKLTIIISRVALRENILRTRLYANRSFNLSWNYIKCNLGSCIPWRSHYLSRLAINRFSITSILNTYVSLKCFSSKQWYVQAW